MGRKLKERHRATDDEYSISRKETTKSVNLKQNNVLEQTCWRTDITASVTASIVVFGIYMKTLHPSVPGGDSGELVTAAYELGVPHPPGYPLFTLLSWAVIKLLPYGTVAWRAHVLNAFFSAATTCFLMLTTLRLTSSSMPAGILATSLFSFSKLTWTWSTEAEVFGLNNFFVAVIMLLCVCFETCRNENKLSVACIGAFICGLALCNQHTIVIYVPIVAIWVLYNLRSYQFLSITNFLVIELCGVMGLVPYLHLPISSAINLSRWTWGDQTTLSGFLTHLIRKEYGTFDLGKDSVGLGFFVGLRAYINHTVVEMMFVGPVLASLGFLVAGRRKMLRQGSCLFLFMIMLTVYVAFFSWRANLDISNPLFRGVVERFWMQSDIIVAMLSGVGFYAVFRVLSWGKENIVLKTLSWIVSIGMLVMQIRQNYEACDNSSNLVVHDFAHSIMDSMPRDAIVFTKGDLPSNSLRYLHLCENMRPDLTIIDQEILSYEWSVPMMMKFYPKVTFPGDFWHLRSQKHPDGRRSFTFKQLLDANYDQHPMFVCIGMQDHDPSWSPQYDLVPFGCCHKIVNSRISEFNPKQWANYTKRVAEKWKYPYETFEDSSWEKIANEEMWQAKINSAFYMYEKANKAVDEGEKLNLYMQSYKLYKRAIENNEKYSFPSYWHKNFALVCEKLAHYEDMHNIEPLTLVKQTYNSFKSYLNKSEDPQAEAIRKAMEHFKKEITRLEAKSNESCVNDSP